MITYKGVEKELIQQNIALLKITKKANTPDNTRTFTVVLESSNEIANIPPRVSSKLIPPKIESSICISASLHQLYNPYAIKALIARAIILGTILSFIFFSI